MEQWDGLLLIRCGFVGGIVKKIVTLRDFRFLVNEKKK